MLVDLNCPACKEDFKKEQKEITRQLKKGRKNFFCSLNCAAIFREEERIEILFKVCPECKTEFQVQNTVKKNKTFCSRGCASSGSMTEFRLNKAKETGKSSFLFRNGNTVENIAKRLKTREGWKYNLLKDYLEVNNIAHEFEFIIENSIYDLVLFDLKIVIEFDGPYHAFIDDDHKTQLAINNGWTIHRVKTGTSEELQIDLIKHLI
jgi:very-short-patch-repair endonuclease